MVTARHCSQVIGVCVCVWRWVLGGRVCACVAAQGWTSPATPSPPCSLSSAATRKVRARPRCPLVRSCTRFASLATLIPLPPELANDLEHFARHAGRVTVGPDDVKLVARKEPGFVAQLDDFMKQSSRR